MSWVNSVLRQFLPNGLCAEVLVSPNFQWFIFWSSMIGSLSLERHLINGLWFLYLLLRGSIGVLSLVCWNLLRNRLRSRVTTVSKEMNLDRDDGLITILSTFLPLEAIPRFVHQVARDEIPR